MNILQNELILSGGYANRGGTNQVWEGSIPLDKQVRANLNHLPPILESR